MLNGRKIAISTSEGFSALPADKYTVQIVDVNLKTKLKYNSTEEEEVLNYKFQILDDNPIEGEDASTRGRFLWKECRPSLNSRSHLGKLAGAVLGRELTKAEADSFDPESLVNKQVDVMVEQSPSKKDPNIIYNNIISFNKTIKQLEPLPIEERNVGVVEKTTTPAVAQVAPDAEAEAFVSGLETATEDPDLEVALLEAKIKAAKAKAELAKKS